MSEQHLHSVTYDAVEDVLTFDGFKFSGELLRTFTATPCGTMFRITERSRGTLTVSQERHPLAAEAPALLALLKRYRVETPLGHQPHMIAGEADDLIARIEFFTNPVPESV